jgi:hypothetical protein
MDGNKNPIRTFIAPVILLLITALRVPDARQLLHAADVSNTLPLAPVCPDSVLHASIEEDSFLITIPTGLRDVVYMVKPVSGRAAQYNGEICDAIGLPCGTKDECILRNIVTTRGITHETTAHMHPHDPDVRPSTAEEYASFTEEHQLALLKVQAFGIVDIKRENVLVNVKTGVAELLDHDAVSPPYLLSEDTHKIEQHVFKEFSEWLTSEAANDLRGKTISRITALIQESGDPKRGEKFLGNYKYRWFVIATTVNNLATEKPEHFRALVESLLQNNTVYLADRDYGDIRKVGPRGYLIEGKWCLSGSFIARLLA